jgi:8-hydroxy-5-deazaflavin:NADPH oxidoreductase
VAHSYRARTITYPPTAGILLSPKLLLSPKPAVGPYASGISPIEGLHLVEAATATMPQLAVLGVGHVGPVVARLAISAGYPVAIATSGDPANLALITELLIPGAEPRWAADAVADADMVVLAMPLHRFLRVDPISLAGRFVIDAMNYWPSSDGVLEAFEDGGVGSSEIVARRLRDSAVVKALNHIGYHELEQNARPTGSPDRRAAGIAADDPAAVAVVAEFVDSIGYDPVRLPSLAAGQVLQPGGPVFGRVLRRSEFEQAIASDQATARTPVFAEAQPGQDVLT